MCSSAINWKLRESKPVLERSNCTINDIPIIYHISSESITARKYSRGSNKKKQLRAALAPMNSYIFNMNWLNEEVATCSQTPETANIWPLGGNNAQNVSQQEPLYITGTVYKKASQLVRSAFCNHDMNLVFKMATYALIHGYRYIAKICNSAFVYDIWSWTLCAIVIVKRDNGISFQRCFPRMNKAKSMHPTTYTISQQGFSRSPTYSLGSIFADRLISNICG